MSVIFTSQEIADVEKSAIASTIIEECYSRIFLPNDRAREPHSKTFYEMFGLNSRQIELIANATPKRDYYLVTSNGRRLFELGLGPAALAFVGASRPADHSLMDRILAEAPGDGFAAAWLEARGLGEAADAVRRFQAEVEMDVRQNGGRR